ncbi:MAG: hypothetical protein IIU14_01130 [Ruminococcus sp.]|nr:hypothetical protein [Ruminococcus sp.]
MQKRIIALLLLFVALLFSSCDDFSYIVSTKTRDTINTNKSNSIKIDKNNSAQEIKAPEYFKQVTLNAGYKTLDTEDMKRVYSAIGAHLNDFTDKPSSSYKGSYESGSFTVENCSITKRQLAKVFFAFSLDHPEVFWLSEPYSFSIYDNKISLTLYFSVKEETQKKRLGQLNAVINSILKGLKKEMTPFERELYIHDYIVKNCKYDKKADESKNRDPYTIYGCLVNQKAVCMGYSYAFQYLLSFAGIKSLTIDGDDDDTGHMWNAVKLDGNWYYTDVTWDDINDISMYDYFNITTEQLEKTHVIVPKMNAYNDDELFMSDGTIKSCNLIIPKCDSLDCNYYVYKGSVLESLSDNTLGEDLARVAENGEEYFHIYVNNSDFDYIYSALFSDESYAFADFIKEANDLLGERVLSTNVVVTSKKDLNVISVQLNYN